MELLLIDSNLVPWRVAVLYVFTPFILYLVFICVCWFVYFIIYLFQT